MSALRLSMHVVALSIVMPFFASGAVQTVKCGDAMNAEANGDFDLLFQSAAQGDHCAELSLARAYFLGHEKLDRDPVIALNYAQKAANSGLDVAQYEIALMYMGGRGIKPDFDKAMHWLTEASSQNYIPAQTSLGRLLIDGRLVKRDIHKGLLLLLRADNNGSEVAKQLLTQMADSLSAQK